MNYQLNAKNNMVNLNSNSHVETSPAHSLFFCFCGPEIDLSESSAGPNSEKRLKKMERETRMTVISYKLPGQKPKLCIPPDSFVAFKLPKSEWDQLREWLSRINERGHANIEIVLGKNEGVMLLTPRKTLAFYLSANKIKIYKCLTIAGANMGLIAKKTEMTYETAKNHVEDLKLAGLVTERKYGKRIRFFTLNRQNPTTTHILKLLDLCDTP